MCLRYEGQDTSGDPPQSHLLASCEFDLIGALHSDPQPAPFVLEGRQLRLILRWRADAIHRRLSPSIIRASHGRRASASAASSRSLRARS